MIYIRFLEDCEDWSKGAIQDMVDDMGKGYILDGFAEEIPKSEYDKLCLEKNLKLAAKKIENEKKSKEIDAFKKKNNMTFKEPDYRDVFEENLENLPIYYDSHQTWWIWNIEKNKWEYTDDTSVLLIIQDQYPTLNLCKSKIRQEVINGLKLVCRKREMITPSNTWIQFKNCIIDVETKKEIELDNKYFFTNPIDWKLGDSDETPRMDELITQWVGKDKLQMIYEIIAYCLIRDYPIHRIFCFTGSGRNGKSKLMGLINKLLGDDNTSTTDLDLLMTRPFESFKLYKKLVCQMGETNYEGLKRTAILKQLCGQDLISFERKGKDGFSDYNYAKLLISTNGIPITHDKSDGFYRRWLITDFPNNFPEGKCILKTIPDEEYNNLCRKCVNLLPRLLEEGKFDKEPTIEEKREIYETKSNPLKLFLAKNCERDFNGFIYKYEFKDKFMVFLNENGYRPLNNSDINALMRDLYDDGKKAKQESIIWAWIGLSWKKGNEISNISNISKDFISTPRVENRLVMAGNVGNVGNEKFLSSINFIFDFVTTIKYDQLLHKIKANFDIDYKDFEEIIEKLKEKGEIVENPKGTLRRL